MRESGAVIVPCIVDDLTDVIYLTSCHLVAHDHVSNHHTSTADRVLAGNHLLVGAAYHEDVEPQFIIERHNRCWLILIMNLKEKLHIYTGL